MPFVSIVYFFFWFHGLEPADVDRAHMSVNICKGHFGWGLGSKMPNFSG